MLNIVFADPLHYKSGPRYVEVCEYDLSGKYVETVSCLRLVWVLLGWAVPQPHASLLATSHFTWGSWAPSGRTA